MKTDRTTALTAVLGIGLIIAVPAARQALARMSGIEKSGHRITSTEPVESRRAVRTTPVPPTPANVLFLSSMASAGINTPSGPFIGLVPRSKVPYGPRSFAIKRFDVPSTGHKYVALTFDDGPSTNTPALLDILNRAGVKATFFLMGLQTEKLPVYAKLIADQGHALGNHTYHHKNLADSSREIVDSEIKLAEGTILKATGIRTTLFRPPFGGLSTLSVDETISLGYIPVLWSRDTRDWAQPGTPAIISKAYGEGQDSPVVLMHDLSGKRGLETIHALPAIIQEYKKNGYAFVTIPELIGSNTPMGVMTGRIAPRHHPYAVHPASR